MSKRASQKCSVAGVPCLRLPSSSKLRPTDLPTSHSHSKCAARWLYVPPSTDPWNEMKSGWTDVTLDWRAPSGLKATPISLARISLPSRAPCGDPGKTAPFSRVHGA
jgi:hypothetical protein